MTRARRPGRTPPLNAKRQRGRSQRRGSIETHVALHHTAGSGNPDRRRILMDRTVWEANRP